MSIYMVVFILYLCRAESRAGADSRAAYTGQKLASICDNHGPLLQQRAQNFLQRIQLCKLEESGAQVRNFTEKLGANATFTPVVKTVPSEHLSPTTMKKLFQNMVENTIAFY